MSNSSFHMFKGDEKLQKKMTMMLQQGKTADDLSSEGSVDMIGGLGSTDDHKFKSEVDGMEEIKRMDDDEEPYDSNKIEALASAQSDVFYKPTEADKVVFTESDEDDEADKLSSRIINQQ